MIWMFAVIAVLASPFVLAAESNGLPETEIRTVSRALVLPTYEETQAARYRKHLLNPLPAKKDNCKRPVGAEYFCSVKPFPSMREWAMKIRYMEKKTSARQRTILPIPTFSNKPKMTVSEFFSIIRHPINTAKKYQNKIGD